MSSIARGNDFAFLRPVGSACSLGGRPVAAEARIGLAPRGELWTATADAWVAEARRVAERTTLPPPLPPRIPAPTSVRGR